MPKGIYQHKSTQGFKGGYIPWNKNKKMSKEFSEKVIVGFPPNYKEIKKFFILQKGVVFCWGDTIYSPDGAFISLDLQAHEKTHSIQQVDYGNIKKWWERYLKDPNFRLAMEVPAYQIQYREAKKISKDRNKLFNYLVALAKDLSGGMYGSIMTFQDAVNAIKNNKVYKFKV